MRERNTIDLELAIGWLESRGDVPKRPIMNLEDECTHILSERLNDQAPIGEERYRPAAQRMIQVITTAERDRVRRELIDWLIGDIPREDAGLYNSRRIADEIDRICPKESRDARS